jgi:DNA (cytosine-5)-methyltransferase 1
MASKVGTVHPPRATHQRYVSGESARHEITLEGELLPWVSMAEALGWGATERPTPTLAVGKTGDGRVWGSDGHGSAVSMLREREASRWVQRERSGDRAEEGFDPHSEPCQTLTEKARSWTVHRPSTTICGSNPGVMNPHGGGRDVPSSARGYIPWTSERPATAVQGDPRISPPGWRGNPEDYKNPNGPTRSGDNAIRVSVSEAAILQSFPADFPWQGSRTAQFRQIGNAVPPLLARAVLSALLESK